MRKIILTVMVMVGCVLTISAQTRVITGLVLNENGAPVEGVSVTSPSASGGTQTDSKGGYSITVPANAKTLLFSYVNYVTVSRPIGRATLIDVTLVPADVNMEEVVVVGYGVQQKKAFTGSASKVDAKEFATLITPSIDKQLAGRAAGVNVNVSGGQVNAPARIRIRGLNSINGTLSPLIVVDGSPITTGNLALVSNSNQLGDINPNDIESIDVLKDGSATAIYGSRGANGVILITTKKGVKGRTSLTYDGVYGTSSPAKRFDLMNPDQFVAITNEKLVNVNQLPLARLDPTGTFTNWQDNVLVNNAPTTSHTIAISGGNEKSTFYVSMNYADSRGIIRTNRNTSYRLRANLESQVNKLIKIGNSLSASRQNDFDQNNGSNALSGSVVAAIRALPNVAIYSPIHVTGYNLLQGANALGAGANLRAIDDNYTNIAFVLDKNKFNSDQYRIINNAFIELSPAKGLKIRSQLGVDYYTDYSTQIYDPRHGDGFSSLGIIFQGAQNILNTNIQNYANYNLTIKGGHNVFLTAGHEIQQTTSKNFSAQGSNISDLFYLKENLISNTAVTQTVGGGYSKSAIESFFGRLNYDYKSKYFLQGSIRRDGQSSLANGLKYGTFPGVSAGWRPSQELFWKNSSFLKNNISDLKLKASYAIVGNRLNGFPYLSTYGSRPYGNLGGIAVSAVGNPILQWERSKKYDIGVEMALLKNRMNISFDYYKNDIDELVLAVPTAFSAGIPNNSINQNVGKLSNKGVELSIDASVVRTKDFEWSVNANYTHVQNTIKELFSVVGVPTTEIPEGNYNINRVGESLYSIYGYRYAGVNSGNGNPVYYNKNGEYVQRNIANGTFYFANSLNDPTLGAATTLTTDDKTILGSALPTDYGAFTNTFRYKGFTLDVMFRYQAGNKIINITRQEILLNQKFANGGVELLRRWNTPGQITDVPKLAYNQEAIVNQNNDAISRFVEDGDFLRLQNVSFSYRMDPKKLQSMSNNAIKSARFFVQAQNVYVWTRYTGIDPEAYSELAKDNSVSPPVRNISVGVSLGL